VQNDFREETEKAGETLTILKDEMLEQNKKYEETIGIYEKQIANAKEKFINDIKELQTKINVYFNQTESFKKSLSVAQEKKNLEKLFEKYADNITQVAQVSFFFSTETYFYLERRNYRFIEGSNKNSYD
jgi:phage shock protein A